MGGYHPRDFWGGLERLVGRLVLLLLAVYLVGELVGGTGFKPWAAVEGSHLEAAATALENSFHQAKVRTGTVTIMLVSQPSSPRAKLLVNGKVEENFATSFLTITVHPNDLLELDGTAEPGILRFRVVKASLNVVQPALGTEVVTQQSIGYLGKVKLKS